MKDYPKDYELPPDDDVSLFYSFDYKQERRRFKSVVSNTFKKRTDPLKAINFTEIVNYLGELEILSLEKGKSFE
tara:strand:+ start:539 stop:760 length:222 start_codon:yes stop_codon:yes gene_type:complete